MVIVGHMSSKSTFGAKNTGQKFLTPKNFWWCRNVCPDSCPGVIFGAGRGSALFFRGGAGQSWKFSGPGRPGAAISPGGGAGRGVHPWLKGHSTLESSVWRKGFTQIWFLQFTYKTICLMFIRKYELYLDLERSKECRVGRKGSILACKFRVHVHLQNNRLLIINCELDPVGSTVRCKAIKLCFESV